MSKRQREPYARAAQTAQTTAAPIVMLNEVKHLTVMHLLHSSLELKNLMRLKFETQPVPAGWQCDQLKGRIKLNYGRSQVTVRSKEGSIPVYGTGGLIEFADRALRCGDSVLFGRKGTLDNPLYIDHPFWPVDTTFYTSDFDGSMKWFHYLSQILELQRFSDWLS